MKLLITAALVAAPFTPETMAVAAAVAMVWLRMASRHS